MSTNELKKVANKAQASKKPKDELEYNRLIKKVAKAQKEKAEYLNELEQQLIWVNNILQPKMTEWQVIKIDIAEKVISSVLEFTNDQVKASMLTNYSAQIVSEIENAPVQLEPEYESRLKNVKSTIQKLSKDGLDSMNDEEREMANGFLEESFHELLNEMKATFKQQGIEVNLDDLSYELDTEELDRIIKERIAAALNGESSPLNEAPKKNISVKQNATDELKSKGISQLYKKLVKWIHPDLEFDNDQKLIKENWMKTLTVAYDKQDLASMLKLETDIILALDIASEKLSLDKLKAYNLLLKEMLSDIDAEIMYMAMAPKYYPLHFYYEPFGGITSDKMISNILLQSMKKQMNEDKKLSHLLKKSENSRNKTLEEIYQDLKAELECDEDPQHFDINTLPF